MHLVARTRGEDIPDIGAKEAELMGKDLDPKSWKGWAVHMRAVRLFMQQTRRDFQPD